MKVESNVEGYFLIGVEVGLATRRHLDGNIHIVIVHEEQARGQYIALLVEDHELVDAGRKRREERGEWRENS